MIFVEVEVSKVSSIRTGIYQDIEKTDPKINLPLYYSSRIKLIYQKVLEVQIVDVLVFLYIF